MRWPFGPPHLTLKPSKKKTQKQKKKQKKRSHQKKAKIPKNSFSIISQIFPFFLVAFQIFPFFTPCPKKRAPKNTIKIGFQALFFESRCASRNGHFWTKKTKIHKFQLSFFCLFSSLSTTKNPNNCWNPYFYSVLANLTKENFQKITLNTENWKKQIAPLLWKMPFLENWKITGHQKQHKMITEHQKSPENPILIVRKWRGPVSNH